MIQKAPVALATSDGKHEVQTFHLQRGEGVPPHRHAYAHDLFLSLGELAVTIDGKESLETAPKTIHFPGDSVHSYEAVSARVVAAGVHPLNSEAT